MSFFDIIMKHFISGFNISSSSVSTIENKTLTYHRMIEAFRSADVQKSKLGDPLYEDLAEVSSALLSNSSGLYWISASYYGLVHPKTRLKVLC